MSNFYNIVRIIELEAEIGDKERYLTLRLKGLKTGSDYYDLITFYEKTEEYDKAVSLAYKALKEADGNISNIRNFLIRHNLNIGNRVEYLKFEFEKAIDGLSYNSYQYFKSICNNEEWNHYEPLIMKNIDRVWKKEQMLIFLEREEHEKVLKLLIDSNPYNYYQIDFDIAEKLKEKYPEEIVNYYIKTLGDYTSAKDRKAYTDQAKIALKIKDIYLNILQKPDFWEKLLLKIKTENKRRPALQEEFSRIIPEWKQI